MSESTAEPLIYRMSFSYGRLIRPIVMAQPTGVGLLCWPRCVVPQAGRVYGME